jgi:hypothetical protein
MQNVSTAIGRPLRVRTAVFVALLVLAAAAMVAVLINGFAPAKHAPVTQTVARSVGSGSVPHDRGAEGVGYTIPASSGDQSSEPRQLRGKPY